MPHAPIEHVLYVEDDEALGRLLQRRLERHGLQVDTVLTAEAALEKLSVNTYDILLVDHILPGISGLELLDELPLLPSPPPAIILTAGGDERVAVAALEKGAADYAVKDAAQTYFDLLPAIMQAAHTKQRLQREYEIQNHELQAAKEKAETASQAKSNFLATMSHEMRTPLNVVIGLAHLLTKMARTPEEQKMVATLLNNADLLLRLINDLLDIGRIESGQVELDISMLDMTDVLKDVRIMFEPQAHEKQIRLVLTDTTAGTLVLGDRMRIQQILMNLVGNAFKFTSHGEISIDASCTEQTPGKISFIIHVRDTGIGVPSEKLGNIFNKFTQADETITRRFGGSGLGLSIVRALVQEMDGDVWVESQPNQGSRFTVSLNLPKALSPDIQKAAKSDNAQRGANVSLTYPKQILVVEDYAPNMMVITLMLEGLGYDVIAVESGEKALEYLRSHHEMAYIILMDVQMHGLDGYDTTRHIRDLEKSNGRRSYIIGVTAHALAGDQELCLVAGMDDYMSKPIHPDILASKLGNLTRQATASAA